MKVYIATLAADIQMRTITTLTTDAEPVVHLICVIECGIDIVVALSV